MTLSAVFLGIVGLVLTFLPKEILEYTQVEINPMSFLILQVLGSLYLGFAMLNWMTKNNLIGGIYNKPLVVGNLAHFFISSFALIKIVGQFSDVMYTIVLTLTVIYAGFALGFGYVFKTNPSQVK